MRCLYLVYRSCIVVSSYCCQVLSTAAQLDLTEGLVVSEVNGCDVNGLNFENVKQLLPKPIDGTGLVRETHRCLPGMKLIRSDVGITNALTYPISSRNCPAKAMIMGGKCASVFAA